MNINHQLFEFICTLIDVQIKKYSALARFGIGPDARMNARLVCDEVQELLELAEQLMQDDVDTAAFISIFTQVEFYLEQEFTRAHAGWLVDANNIHSPVVERVIEQLEQLNDIACEAEIKFTMPTPPVTEIQKQCQHDSVSIAFKLLDLVKRIKENPEMDLDPAIPVHAAKILRANATTRFNQPDIAREVEGSYRSHKLFLEQSALTITSNTLQKDEAEGLARTHISKLTELMERYRLIQPDSKLFSEDYKPYFIDGASSANEAQIKPAPQRYSFGLWGVAAGVAVFGSYMLMRYFRQQAEEHSVGASLAP